MAHTWDNDDVTASESLLETVVVRDMTSDLERRNFGNWIVSSHVPLKYKQLIHDRSNSLREKSLLSIPKDGEE